MIPTVAVQLAEPQHEHAPLLVDACTVALRHGQCDLEVAKVDTPPRAVAIVTWRDEEHSMVLVEVGTSERVGARWVSQQVEFVPADPQQERWRVVGITIATLVGDLEAETEATKSDPEPTPDAEPAAREQPIPTRNDPPPPAAVETPSPPRDRARQPSRPAQVVAVSVGGSLALPIAGGVPRIGGWARGDWIPARSLLVTVAGDYSVRPGTEALTTRWLGVSAGTGLWHRVGPVRVDARIELLLERVVVESAGAGAASKALAGGRLGLTARWPTRGHWGVVGGGEFTRYSRGVRILRDEAEVVTFPPSTYTLIVGLQRGF